MWAPTQRNTSPDGLRLLEFHVTPTKAKAGNTIKVLFRLKNETNQPIKFDPRYGVFVGARWNSTTDDNNRDFGHKYKKMVLKPGREIFFKGSRKLDKAGTWRFWPAYNVNGHWGPFRWNEIVLEVAEKPASGKPSKPPAGKR